MRVGAHERVGEHQRRSVERLGHHAARQVLEIHLVHDPGGGRHHAEVAERFLPPAQELVALAIALELDLGVALERDHVAEHVDLDRVVDHEIDRHQRIDPLGIAAEAPHGVAHRGQVHHARHAGEVLQDHASGLERDLLVGGLRRPAGDALDIRFGDLIAVAGAQRGFEQDANREGQTLERDAEARSETIETIDVERAGRRLELGERAKGIGAGVHGSSFPVTTAHRAVGRTGGRTGSPEP